MPGDIALGNTTLRDISAASFADGPEESPVRQLHGENATVRELLLALSLGFALPGPLPQAVTRKLDRLVAGAIDAIVARSESRGLLLPDGTVSATAKKALLAATSTDKIHAFQRELVDHYMAQGRPLGQLASEMAQSGLIDSRVAAELEDAADSALEHDPGLAAQLYDEALLAGGDETATAARRAQAFAGRGDLDSAGRIVDRLLARPEAPDLHRAVDVAAAVWAHRGRLSGSAGVYTWLGAGKIGRSAPLAVVALVGCGDRAGAEAMLAGGAVPASPTLLGVALTQTGTGILESLEAEDPNVLPTLIQASDSLNAAGSSHPLPETPGSLAALVALHSGEPGVAETTARSAIAAGQGGDAAKPRLHLLHAWSAMQQDNPENAGLAIHEASKANPWPLLPRDEFLCAALEVGLARRSGDVHDLLKAWERAREAMLHISVDLYSLLPWGELMIAAARLRETRRVAHYLDEAWKLLGQLGDPPLWAVPLRWAGVQAALLNESPGDLAPHAAALGRAASHSHLASVLAGAGKMWVRVLAGRFAAADVETAARGLKTVGMTWEGARLAGHAAARTDERKDMIRLLACARDLHPQGGQAGSSASIGSQTPESPVLEQKAWSTRDGSELSEREKEVARLVLEGKTYREIGEAIYISPRTAEHHMARVRRRLGAENRSELLARLRLALGTRHPGQE